MVPAQVKDPISSFLSVVEETYAHQFSKEAPVKCEKLLVEDNYEVDVRYSIEDCLSDMMKVTVSASLQPKHFVE